MSQKRQTAIFDPRHRKGALTTLSYDYPSGYVVPPHFHEEDQLVYAAAGVMSVETPQATWIVPPLRAVWVPGRTVHSIRMSGEVAMKTLYLAPRLAKTLPRTCCVINAAPLLRELVAHVCARGELHRDVPADRRLLEVLLDLLDAAPSLPLQLPLPLDARALRVARALLDDPSDARPLAAICARSGASKRTIERAFSVDTGMSFGKWREQLRLAHALRRLASGEKVTSVALEAGYASPSAFISMFRRVLGTTPGDYFKGGTERPDRSDPNDPASRRRRRRSAGRPRRARASR